MRTEVEIRERLDLHERRLHEWAKPTMEMRQRAPTVQERRPIIERHAAVALVLRLILRRPRMTEAEIRALLEEKEAALTLASVGPLESADAERERRRAQISTESEVHALRWVLQDKHAWPYEHDFAPWERNPEWCAMCGRTVDDPMHIGSDEGPGT